MQRLLVATGVLCFSSLLSCRRHQPAATPGASARAATPTGPTPSLIQNRGQTEV